ncbi:hypothetical protein R1sor_004717 [Riccia sorocarpa]|uniref:CNNM transmembrane domain-containing protein n=1 Tax=Riccia sorocarpa TaxID=122646 RepID=A0ABD3HJF5_9MARC
MGHTIQQHCCKDTFWFYIGAIVGLLAFSGLMSGLTLGLMSLGLVDLEVIRKSGKPEDQRNAAKILPVVKDQHLLLVTLLLGNALAMEILPLFLDSVVSTYMAIILSVTLILLFGEILPQAVCSRHGLAVGAAMAPLVRVLIIIMFPVAYPLSKLLDCVLGKKHSILFGRAELRTLVEMHGYAAGKGGDLNHYETTIISGALTLTERTAGQVMTPISETLSMDVNSKLDRVTVAQVMGTGQNRIPVYSGKHNNIVGVVLASSLACHLFERPNEEVSITQLAIRKIPRVAEDMSLDDVLHEFQQSRSNMAVVVRYKNVPCNCKDSESTTNPAGDCDHHSVSYGNSAPSDEEDSGNCKQVEDKDKKNVYLPHKHLALDMRPVQTSPSYSTEVGDRHQEERTQPQLQHEKQKQEGVTYGKSEGVHPWVSWANEDGKVVGIITLEDVFQELLQEKTLGDGNCSVIDLFKPRISEQRLWSSKAPPRNTAEHPLERPPTTGTTPQNDRPSLALVPYARPRARYSFSAPGSPKRNSSVSALETANALQSAKRISPASAPGSPSHHHGSSGGVQIPVSLTCPRALARVRLGSRASVKDPSRPSVAVNSRIHIHRMIFSNSSSFKEHERGRTTPAEVRIDLQESGLLSQNVIIALAKLPKCLLGKLPKVY